MCVLSDNDDSNNANGGDNGDRSRADLVVVVNYAVLAIELKVNDCMRKCGFGI